MERHDEAKTIFTTQVELTVDLISKAIKDGRPELVVWYLMSLADAASKSLAFLSDNAVGAFLDHLEGLIEDRASSLGNIQHPEAVRMPISTTELNSYFPRHGESQTMQSPDPGAGRKH
jgi:hypothetical protein